MRKRFAAILIVCILLLSSNTKLGSAPSYRVRNTELGIAYTVEHNKWDGQQWDSIFQDSAPPMGWVFLPLGKESCNAISPDWIRKAKSRGFNLGIVLVPFLNVDDIKRTVDCAAARGFRRVVLDEFVSHQTLNLGRPLCTVLSDIRNVYQYTKSRHPGFQFDIDDNWQTWIGMLSRGQAADSCGAYPHFKTDQAGVSVFSKYGNPAQNFCGHPTAAEIHEQLLDLKQTVRDYSRTRKIFAWQLNQNWYPGGDDVLQIFRQLKPVYGFEPFLLYGPTSTNDAQDNWGYRIRGRGETCPQNNFEWYLPARDYLIRIREGAKTTVRLQGPPSVGRGSVANLNGRLQTTRGISGNVELQIVPPVGSRQFISREVVAPSDARLAFVGVRINSQIPRDIKGSADLMLSLVQLFEKGGTRNLVDNPDFNDGFSSWISLSTANVSVVNDGSDKSIRMQSSPQQVVSITSTPILVSPGKTYTVNFHAKLFSESRNNGYFYIAWNSVNEIKRDRIYMKFPDRQTVAAAVSRPDGTFRFSYQPMESGVYTLYGFFRGNRSLQPSIRSFRLNVN
jgi:hypothetical protein